jgi:hypothetical protein
MRALKLHSASQITELLVNDKRESARERLYSITVTLQDPSGPGIYKAEADVTYAKADSGWKIAEVDLRSFIRVR